MNATKTLKGKGKQAEEVHVQGTPGNVNTNTIKSMPNQETKSGKGKNKIN